MKLYTIRNWNELYENNRSRTVSDLSWVKLPNRHDGEHYSRLITSKNGSVIFSAFVLMVQVASRCHPRGTLLRDNKTPHNSESLALKTRAPEKWFKIAFEYLENNTDWLISTAVTQETDRQLPPDCHPGDEERRDKKEERREEAVVISDSEKFKSGDFKAAWLKWIAHREQLKKPRSGFAQLFREQLIYLERFEEATATEMINKSLREGWTGLFEITGKAPSKKYVPNI